MFWAYGGSHSASPNHQTPDAQNAAIFNFFNFYNFPTGNVCTRGGQREAYPFRVGKFKKLKNKNSSVLGVWRLVVGGGRVRATIRLSKVFKTQWAKRSWSPTEATIKHRKAIKEPLEATNCD